MMKKRKEPRPPRKPTAKPAPQGKPSRNENRSFPIIGIGASAGGLEALELFLKHVPKGSGMALVIVQHLDPTRKDMMVELLQRATAMPVAQVKDRTRVQPNRVYVIPPNKDMSILHGVLHLLAPTAARGLRLPIDFFLRSLADDRQERSIGVILSGMGTDGTLGLRAIKERAGVAFVQSPDSAKFDGMPRSAIDAGLADVVAPAEELPGRILAYLQHAPLLPRSEPGPEDKTHSAMEKIVILLRGQTGHDFSLYKNTTIYRRVERRMGLHQIGRIVDYVRYLRENPKELDLLFKELLIGVTSFFRDPAAWDQLRDEVLPKMLAGRSPDQPLRAWVAGCSTGEEAYSLAIVFREAMEKLKQARNFTLQIFATDLDRDAVKKAREGVFPANIAADVSAERLGRFFVKEDRGYQVAKPVREMVIFAPQNLIMDPPFTKLAILSCRNLLIYLTAELQGKLIPLFHYSLEPGGCLFLGSAETVGRFTDLFTPRNDRSRLYRRTESTRQGEPVEFPPSFTRAPPGESTRPQTGVPKPSASIEAMAERMLVEHHSPAAVLVTDKGDILYISARTGKYLEPAVGKANLNIFAMAREGLRHELATAFRTALGRKSVVTLRDVVVGTGSGAQVVDVAIHHLEEPEPLRGMVLIVFTDVATPPPALARRGARRAPSDQAQMAEVERELQQARQETRTTKEEMQTSQEELRSVNEEMQSTNEELQSTNEELTTSKEEMQSLNEELQTVNHELQAKVEDLSRVGSDMKNLLDSTDIAVVFLDDELRVRRFTSQAGKLTNLIATDVGRLITDLASDLLYPEFADDTRGVLRSLVGVEKQIPAGDDRWFAVRILPYRTMENTIDGVVITFVEITTSKMLEVQLRRAQAGLERHIEVQDAKLERAADDLKAEKSLARPGKGGRASPASK